MTGDGRSLLSPQLQVVRAKVHEAAEELSRATWHLVEADHNADDMHSMKLALILARDAIDDALNAGA